MTGNSDLFPTQALILLMATICVKIRQAPRLKRCPLLLQYQTLVGAAAMSALGHKQTHAVQQLVLLLDHLVGDSQQIWRDSKAKRFRRLEIEG